VVFAGGPRQIDAARAGEIVSVAAGLPVLAVSGSATAEELLRLRDRSGIAGVQLHGDHPVSLAGQLRAEGLLVWEVARLTDAAGLNGLASTVEPAWHFRSGWRWRPAAAWPASAWYWPAG
jgi:phosphoribosylanthranilate isomerase